VQQLKPFRFAGAGMRRQGALRRLNRLTGIFGIRKSNLSDHLATRRIEQVEHLGAMRCYKSAVDINSFDHSHDASPPIDQFVGGSVSLEHCGDKLDNS